MNKNGWKILYWVNLFKKALPPHPTMWGGDRRSCEHRPRGVRWNGVFELAGFSTQIHLIGEPRPKTVAINELGGADGPDSTLASLRRAGAAVLDPR